MIPRGDLEHRPRAGPRAGWTGRGVSVISVEQPARGCLLRVAPSGSPAWPAGTTRSRFRSLYAERIARLRAYYFDCAPEITSYLASVPLPQRLAIMGLRAGYRQGFRTVAGMVAVVTAVLTGSAAGLIAGVAPGHSGVAGFVTGGVVALAVLVVLMRFQHSAWNQTHRRWFLDGRQGAAPQASPER